MIDHRDASTSTRHPQSSVSRGAFEEPAISGNVFNEGGRLDRENTFEKMCVVGPRGNLTGTPRGTGMQEAGSSIADTSSPGIDLTSSASRRSSRYPGFYATPFAAIGSVTRVHRSHLSESIEPTHAPSEVTLFPKGGDDDSGRSLHKNRPLSLRCSTTFEKTQRRTSRTAVPGQTKLREMMLSPKTNRKHVGSQDTTFSRFMGGSERPSTSDTMTPLQRKRSIEISSFVPPVDTRHYSPHLLCPERAVTPEVEHRQQKLSWIILGVFCLLPPCIFLYRIWGDHIISSVTHGQIPDCTAKSKRMALIAGIVVNIALIVAIIVPVVVAVALGVA